ncbi:MAG TPA: hypothetical protein VLC46_24180 [Thermoanaerobaculia bacterium]|nr:hypothetical protein [Thermoanaerobaculia bacterium]
MNIQHSTLNFASLNDRRVAEWLILLTLATYAYFFAGGGWNQNATFDLTRAIVERHTLAIDAYAGNTGDVSFGHGHIYANKAPALSWLMAIPYAPLYAFEHARGADTGNVQLLTINAYICSLFCVALPGAFIPSMLFLYARRRGFEARWSALASLSVALATQLLPYATIPMVAVPSAALLLFALITPHRSLGGFAAALAVAMNYLCAPALVLFALVGPRKSWLRYAAGSLAPLAGLLAYQRLCFGGFFTTSVAVTDPRFLTHGAPLGVLQRPSLAVLYAITLSPYRGFFFFAPLLIVAIAGFLAWWRRERIVCAAAIAVIVAFVSFNISFNGWEGGFGIGGRYLVPLIPLFGIALLHARWRALAGVAAAISFAINFAAVAVDPQPSGTITRPLTQYIVPLLLHGHFAPSVPITPPWSAATFTGHTSVNRLTLDEAIVFARHAPGSEASEWTSFNIGELATGPGDVRSLIPIALIILGAGFVLARLAAKSTAEP